MLSASEELLERTPERGERDGSEWELPVWEPADFGDVVCGSDRAGGQRHSVDRGQDGETAWSVAVGREAQQPQSARSDAQFFAQLAAHSCLWCLAGFDEATGQIPRPGVRRVGALGEQDAAPAADDGEAREDRVVVEGPAAARAPAAPPPVLADRSQACAARDADVG